MPAAGLTPRGRHEICIPEVPNLTSTANATIEPMHHRQHLVAVARGDAPADRLIRGARVVNVYSGEIVEANVALAGKRIAYVGPRQPAAREILDAAGLYLAPGWSSPTATRGCSTTL